jgi:hypothetical protein
MTRIFALTVLGVALQSGCATTPVSGNTAKSVPPDRLFASEMTTEAAGRSSLTVTRDSGMMGAACAAKFFLDGKHIADLKPKEQVRLYVVPGEYIAGVRSPGGICGGGTDQTSFAVKPDRSAALRIAWGQAGDLKIEPSAF